MQRERDSIVDRISEEMLGRIERGAWALGAAIPSERSLMEDFGVSRIALREALARLRALGVLNVSHGRKTTVEKLDTRLFSRLFPLVLSHRANSTFQHVFQVRLALESQTAYQAAQCRTDEDVILLEALLRKMHDDASKPLEEAVEADLAFHMQIAHATQNPLFPALLEALSRFVTCVQVLSCKDDPTRRERAEYFHHSIFEAIWEQDAERARVEMQSHLRSSAHDLLNTLPSAETL